MGLRLHDTATRQVRDFVPLVDDVVTMYQCGATVQSSPHVGHIRAGVCFDVLVRWLMTSGYNVVLVRNVTDIDDKILAKSVTEELPWWAVAAKYEREFQTAYRVLGCTPPTGEPRATGHVPQMIELIARLIDAGHAYPANGDVYFDVRSWDAYGSLSRQNIDDLLPAADSADVQGKKDPRDFALWKGVPDDAEHPLPIWSTPWGSGRPGWHLECSAMATTYLGSQFDIHGGGLDLVFPHHENELAQSRAAGDEFARYWLHNAWVTTAGEKMSKSLGNSLIIEQVLQRVRPIDLRWYLVASHYRSNLEFSDDALAESAASFQRIENFVLRAGARTNAIDALGDVYDLLPAEFVDAMNDDLGVPAAVAVLHHHVTEGNRLLNSGSDDEALANELRTVRAMLDVLGVDPFASHWESADDQSDAAQTALSALISDQLAARKQARADKDFAKADEIRDSLTAAGIALEDGPDGTRWSLATEQ